MADFEAPQNYLDGLGTATKTRRQNSRVPP
jgi:hypothetical protein